MITACLIVKNEEKHIGTCLEKLPKYIDEIIVVDTGSSDKTLDILKSFNAKVYHFEWCDDFSKARNFGISKATNEWILVLDADEYVDSFDEKEVSEFINGNNNKILGEIKIKSFLGELFDYKVEYISRLFNKNFYSYKYEIHEQLCPIDEKIKASHKKLPISVEHFGYTLEVSKEKDKNNFYIKLLKNQLSKEFIPYYSYHLAVCYLNIGDFEKCVDEVNKLEKIEAIETFNFFTKLISTKIKALLNLERIDEALEMEKYFEICKGDDSYLYMLALTYRYIHEAEQSLNIYEHLYAKEDLQISRDTVIYALADIFYCYGLFEDAKVWFLKLPQTDKILEQVKLCDDKINSKEQ